MANLAQLVQSVLSDPAMQETDWLEWKSQADLSQRLWQARAARFILAAANRPRTSAAGPYEGCAFLLLGVEPGQAHGTNVVDPAVVEQGLAVTVGPSVQPIALSTSRSRVSRWRWSPCHHPPPALGHTWPAAPCRPPAWRSRTGGSTSGDPASQPRPRRRRSTRCSPNGSLPGLQLVPSGRCRPSPRGGMATSSTWGSNTAITW
jgi:hypothetical protein